MGKKKGDWNTLKWIHRQTAGNRISLVILFFVKLLQGVEGIVFAFLLRDIIDSAVEKNRDKLILSSVYISIVVIAAILLYMASFYFTDRCKIKLGKAYRLKGYRELLVRSYSDVRKVHSGHWLTRINSDSGVIAAAVTSIIPTTAGLIAQFIAAVVSLFILLPKTIWFLIPLGIGMVILSLFLRTKLKNYHKEVQVREGRLVGFIQESLNSFIVIRSFSKEKDMIKLGEAKMEDIVDVKMKRNRFIASCVACIYALIRIGYVIVAFICSYQLYGDLLSYGTMMAILRMVSQIDQPLSEVAHAIPQFFNMLASAERMMEIEKLEPDYNGPVRSLSEARDFYKNNFAGIELKNAGFTYEQDDRDPVLRNFDLRIEKGDYVAFTGESGCGKSTTMNILMGLYRLSSGEATVFDTSHNRFELTSAWRSLFAYVPQENLLMSGTIREAVSFSDPSGVGDDERLWTSLEASCAADFVRELPQGLDTPLGEKGAGLSEGQMQRIAIARALFSERPILMLDESTSALDEVTEKDLLKQLKKLTDRTVVIITHRPAALEICNKTVDFSKA